MCTLHLFSEPESAYVKYESSWDYHGNDEDPLLSVPNQITASLNMLCRIRVEQVPECPSNCSSPSGSLSL